MQALGVELAKVVVFEMHGGGTELENDGGILEAQAAFFNRFVRILGLAQSGGVNAYPWPHHLDITGHR